MHICFICHEYPPSKGGGIGSFTQTIGRALVKRGHRVTVIGIYTSYRLKVEDDQGVRVIRIPGSFIPYTGFIINSLHLQHVLHDLYKKEGIDILEGPNSSLALIPKSFPVPKVMRFHGGHRFFTITLGKRPSFWRSLMETLSIRHADFFCAVSRYNAEVNRLLLRLKYPIEVLYNPVDTDFFHPRPEIEEKEGLLLFVGTLCEKKGIKQLIQATPLIFQSASKAYLWIVGRDTKDPKTRQSFWMGLKSLIPHQFSERIVFRGPVERDQIPELMAQAQICVFPSLMEAHPIVWLEALAMGKPLVASRTGPGPEVVEDGISGLLCNPYDPHSIADKVIQLLQNKNMRENMKKEARNRVLEKFSIKHIVEQNEHFYHRCIQQWMNK